MADNGSFPDDISELWGSEDEGALTAAPVDEDVHRPVERAVANGNGSGNGSAMAAVEHAIHGDVARLAAAIGSDQVRRADLEGLRTEFAHQLGVALYELISVSNAGLAKAEDHINARVAATVEAHTDRLAAAIEAHSRSTVETISALRAELDALGQLLAEPDEGVLALRQDLHDHAGRLSEQLEAQATQAAHRLEAEAERRHRTEMRATKTDGEVGDIAGTLAAIKDEVAQIRQEVTVLRDTVETQSRRSRRWGRAR